MMLGLSKVFRRGDSVDEYVRSADERALVRRLDMFLLTFGCLSQGRRKKDLRKEKSPLQHRDQPSNAAPQ